METSDVELKALREKIRELEELLRLALLEIAELKTEPIRQRIEPFATVYSEGEI